MLKIKLMRSGTDYLRSLKQWGGHGKFDLENISLVLDQLGNPQRDLKCVHVAGTNGKGSVSTMISAILGASGYRVGLTISPHLVAMNERIVIDGHQVSDKDVEFAGTEIQAASSSLNIELSFFEAITAAAFLLFRHYRVDWAVVEVGLGGRLDATNVIERPAATVIVSVDLDHQRMLGDTVAQIASEKAGIMKLGVPVVCGYLAESAQNIVSKRAGELSCSQVRFGQEFGYRASANEIIFKSDEHSFPIKPSLKGKHQLINASVAAATCNLLGCNVEAIQAGISGAFWPARLELIEFNGIEFLLDAGHNPAGISALVEYLRDSYTVKPAIIFGAINTKNWKSMVDLLVPHVSDWFILEPQSESAISSKDVFDYLSSNDIKSVEFGRNYSDCLDELRRSDFKQVLVTGSIYMLGALRAKITNNINVLWHRAVLD